MSERITIGKWKRKKNPFPREIKFHWKDAKDVEERKENIHRNKFHAYQKLRNGERNTWKKINLKNVWKLWGKLSPPFPFPNQNFYLHTTQNLLYFHFDYSKTKKKLWINFIYGNGSTMTTTLTSRPKSQRSKRITHNIELNKSNIVRELMTSGREK